MPSSLLKLVPVAALLLSTHPSFGAPPSFRAPRRVGPFCPTSAERDRTAHINKWGPIDAEAARRRAIVDAPAREAAERLSSFHLWQIADANRTRAVTANRVNADPNSREYYTQSGSFTFRSLETKRQLLNLFRQISELQARVDRLPSADVQRIFAGTDSGHQSVAALREQLRGDLRFRLAQLQFQGNGIPDYTVASVAQGLAKESWMPGLLATGQPRPSKAKGVR